MSILEEDFLGKKPNVAHFRMFGSSFYYHITKDAHKRKEPIVELGIFVGYMVHLTSIKCTFHLIGCNWFIEM